LKLARIRAAKYVRKALARRIIIAGIKSAAAATTTTIVAARIVRVVQQPRNATEKPSAYVPSSPSAGNSVDFIA
jgi:hypothetical protein